MSILPCLSPNRPEDENAKPEIDPPGNNQTTVACPKTNCRAMGDSAAAINYFEESVEFLTKLPTDDLEITHTLSVSLNKIGDLKYYHGDLQAARSYYLRSLGVRRDVIKNNSGVASQVIDVAVSLAKVADVDTILGKDDEAIDGFQEAIKPQRLSVLAFLRTRLEEKQSEATVSLVSP